MTEIKKQLAGTGGALLVVLGALAVPALGQAGEADAQTAKLIEAGQKLAFTRSKGNCLACHHIDGGESPGSIGPPLIAMNVRYPDKDKLRAQIWDATIANPETPMPPFGRHQILSDWEIDALVEFIWSK